MIHRRRMPYWKERGWERHNGCHRGFYRTRYGSWAGYIYPSYDGRHEFYVYNPPRELAFHPHWTCFTHQGENWFKIHFSKKPEDMSSGIMQIERMINESFRLTKKS